MVDSSVKKSTSEIYSDNFSPTETTGYTSTPVYNRFETLGIHYLINVLVSAHRENVAGNNINLRLERKMHKGKTREEEAEGKLPSISKMLNGIQQIYYKQISRSIYQSSLSGCFLFRTLGGMERLLPVLSMSVPANEPDLRFVKFNVVLQTKHNQ